MPRTSDADVKDQTSASVGDSPEVQEPQEDVAPDPTPTAQPEQPVEEDLGNDPILETDPQQFRVSLVRRVTVTAKNIDDEDYEHTALDLDDGPISVQLGALDRENVDRDYLDDEGRIVLGDKPIVVDADAASLLTGLPFAKVEAI